MVNILQTFGPHYIKFGTYFIKFNQHFMKSDRDFIKSGYILRNMISIILNLVKFYET